MSKKLFLLVVLATALSVPAFADNETMFNPGGSTGVGVSWGVADGALFAGVFSRLRTPAVDLGGDRLFTNIGVQLPTRFPHFNPHPGPGQICQAVPEPGELSLIGAGLVGLVATIRRKYKR